MLATIRSTGRKSVWIILRLLRRAVPVTRRPAVIARLPKSVMLVTPPIVGVALVIVHR